MPWVRRSIHSNRMYGIGVAIAALMMGVLLGYQWWGSTAAVVAVVEKELAGSMARLSALDGAAGHDAGIFARDPERRSCQG
jgi:hypothetical protein